MIAAWKRQRSIAPALMLACVLASALPAVAAAEQASAPTSATAGSLDVGAFHSCATLAGGVVRCWGYAGNGQLGYGNTDTIADDETPGSVGPVDLGPGRTAKAISAGDYHTCALLDDNSVRCWGYGADGRLGYGNTSNVGDAQSAGSVGPVYLGAGRTAKAISAGGAHTCAILDTGAVLCWGYGALGELGYGNKNNVGDVQRPGDAGPINLGGRRAVAISAGAAHTCAIVVGGDVLCWGFGQRGRLGYADTSNVGDSPATTPALQGPVDIGTGRTAVAISAGGLHTCAVLDHGDVRCWGWGSFGQLGYSSTDNVGATQTPGSVGPVDLGGGKAVAIAAGQLHTCALLDNGSMRCWGLGNNGRLGYGNTATIGIFPSRTPASVGPVDLGAGRTATAITAGESHTCARLDNGTVRCWGAGANGRLGYCAQNDVGDDEAPGSVGPVSLQPGDGGAGCPPAPPGGTPETPPGDAGVPETPPPPAPSVASIRVDDALVVQARRARALRGCYATAARQRTKRRRSRARKTCLSRYGRTPGPVGAVRARAASRSQITLSFRAAGSDGSHAPAARAYLVKQSGHPIRRARDFRQAKTLCRGNCRFRVRAVGTKISLRVTHLRAHRTYYYAIEARDNVSNRLGPRSRTVKVRAQ